MERYNQAQKDKKDLQKKMTLLSKEYRSYVNSIDMAKASVQEGLLDVQTKTKNLKEVMDSISNALKEDKQRAQDELAVVKMTRKRPVTRRMYNRAAYEAHMEALSKRERQLESRIKQDNMKLEWITGQRQKTDTDHLAAGMINLMSNKRGFKAILNNIRVNKAGEEAKLPQVTKEHAKSNRKPDFSRARNVCELIDEFHKLPKVYENKPVKPKSDRFKMAMEEYEERRHQRELAMSYGTRTRLRRARYCSDLITSIYKPSSGNRVHSVQQNQQTTRSDSTPALPKLKAH